MSKQPIVNIRKLKILEVLMNENGNLPTSVVANKVGLCHTTTLDYLKQLEKEGLVIRVPINKRFYTWRYNHEDS